MNRALGMLVRFRHIGGWRHFWRSGRGSALALVGKALILCYLVVLAAGWAWGVCFALLAPHDDPIRTWLRSGVETYARLAPIPLLFFLVLACILSAFERQFRFAPAELEFIQAGPFTRRQMLMYKMGSEFSVMVVLALLAAQLGTALFPFLSGFLGALLILNLFYLVATVVSLIATTLGFHGSRGPLRGALALVIIAATLAFFWFTVGRRFNNPAALYQHVNESWGWHVALTPLSWFVETTMATRVWPDLVRGAALCLLVNAGLVATVFALDANLQRREDDDERAVAATDSPKPVESRVRWSFPLSRSWNGAGTVAWRQAMNVIRKPHQMGFALYLNAMVWFVFYMIVRYAQGLLFLPTLDGHLEVNPAGIWICGVLSLMLPMLVASGLSFDFRGDVGRIDVLKALPMPPMAVVAGQLFVPVVLVSVMQWILMLVIAIALRSIPLGLWVATVFAPPVSVVLIAIENLPTFWIPLRQTPGAKPEPFELFGHVLLHPLIRMIGYAIATVATVVVAALAFFIFGNRLSAAIIAAWLTLAACGLGLVRLMAHTFDRFDVTQDVPA